jgi:hypothetical protein
MNTIDASRIYAFELRNELTVCDKSPELTASLLINDYLSISYCPDDSAIILPVRDILRDILLDSYNYVKNWFHYGSNLIIELRIMPGTEHARGTNPLPRNTPYPSSLKVQDWKNSISLLFPLFPNTARDIHVFSGLLAHLIAHHFITAISGTASYHTKPRLYPNVPVWLEEGLCQVIQGEVDQDFRHRCLGRIQDIAAWPDLRHIWNDLPCSTDLSKAQLQAYWSVYQIVRDGRKTEIIRLLRLNRLHHVNWKSLVDR